jgi:hypothetical protein
MALYNRALSADEVDASYAEHVANAGGRAEPLPTRSNQNFRMVPHPRFPVFNSD